MNHPPDERHGLYGLMAEFDQPESLVAAARQARAAGYSQVEGYSPFPVEGLDEALALPATILPWVVLLGAIGGALAGLGLQTYTAVFDYPLNVGGRPYFSWPAFVPVIFELAILGGATLGVLAMFAFNRLPEPYHPVFNATGFHRASTDRFFLCVRSDDPRFDPQATAAFLAGLKPLRVEEVAF